MPILDQKLEALDIEFFSATVIACDSTSLFANFMPNSLQILMPGLMCPGTQNPFFIPLLIKIK